MVKVLFDKPTTRVGKAIKEARKRGIVIHNSAELRAFLLDELLKLANETQTLTKRKIDPE
jgi:hypothetical protein